MGANSSARWSLAKIIAVYPGKDKVVRTVDVQVETRIIPPNCNTKDELAKKMTTRTSVYRRPVCKLSMLLAVDEVPEGRISIDEIEDRDEL